MPGPFWLLTSGTLVLLLDGREKLVTEPSVGPSCSMSHVLGIVNNPNNSCKFPNSLASASRVRSGIRRNVSDGNDGKVAENHRVAYISDSEMIMCCGLIGNSLN